MISRRQFVTRTAMVGAGALLLRGRAWPFDQSPTGVQKFLATLPGLGPAEANNFGNYIPVLSPNKTKFPGTDYYEIVARKYSQQVHLVVYPALYELWKWNLNRQTELANAHEPDVEVPDLVNA
jgi:hypothetical protein